MNMNAKTVEEVQSWLEINGFAAYCVIFKENEIDGEALEALTERALEILIPSVGSRMKFMKLLSSTKHKDTPTTSETTTLQATAIPSTSTVNVDDDCEGPVVGGGESANSPARSIDSRKRPHSPESKTIMNARLPWPATLTLPSDYRPEVLKVLKDNDPTKVTRKFRRAFIGRLYDHFSRYTLYPTKHQLAEISQLIIKTYPCLKDKCIGTGYDSWHATLYEKFRNERKSLQDDPEVTQRKKAREQNSATTTLNNKLKRGGINWEPLYPEGEDEVSLKRHKEFLQRESTKKRPDVERINQRMELTFADRRRYMNTSPTITDVRVEFPTLFDFDQIVADFQRVLGLSQGVISTFEMNFQQVAKGVMEIATTRKLTKKVEKVKEMVALLESEDDLHDTDCEPTTDEIAEVALTLLPFLVQPKPGSVSLHDFVQFIPDGSDPKEVLQSPTPSIVMEGNVNAPGQVFLCADRQVLCCTSCSLVKATVGLMAVFYIFLYQYPPKLRNFFLYLQKCILHIQDGQKLPTSVIEFVNELDSFTRKC